MDNDSTYMHSTCTCTVTTTITGILWDKSGSEENKTVEHQELGGSPLRGIDIQWIDTTVYNLLLSSTVGT